MSTPADSVDTGTDDSEPQGALSQTYQAPGVSPSGKVWADNYLKAHPQGVDTSGESALLQQQDADAQEARATLQKARERLASQRVDPSVLGLRVAQALMSPSKGGVPDQWSRAFGSVADWRQQNQQFQNQQGAQDLDLAQQLQGVDKQSLAARLALQELKERTGTQTFDTALKVAGSGAPTGPTSPIGKLVTDRLGPNALQTPAGGALFDKLLAQEAAKKAGQAAVSLPPELQKAVDEGRLDPTRINSRTAPMLSQLAIGNPTLDFNKMHSDAALQANPAFQQRAMTMEALPQLLSQVNDLGQKIGFSDIRTVGKMQAFLKGELNDPDYAAYMTKRNDALMNLASVMRGQGMSDQAHRAEIEAAAPTMAPTALSAWYHAQLEALQPRLQRTEKVMHDTPTGDLVKAAPTGPIEGATATNRATGERLVFKGGKWQPLTP